MVNQNTPEDPRVTPRVAEEAKETSFATLPFLSNPTPPTPQDRLHFLCNSPQTPNAGRYQSYRQEREEKKWTQARAKELEELPQLRLPSQPQWNKEWTPSEPSFTPAHLIQAMDRPDLDSFLASELLDALTLLPTNDVLWDGRRVSMNPALPSDLLEAANRVNPLIRDLRTIVDYTEWAEDATRGISHVILVNFFQEKVLHPQMEAVEKVREEMETEDLWGSGATVAVESKCIRWSHLLNFYADRCRRLRQQPSVVGVKVVEVLDPAEAFLQTKGAITEAAVEIYNHFAHQLHHWLSNGILDDPYQEFFIHHIPRKDGDKPSHSTTSQLPDLRQEYVIRRERVGQWVLGQEEEILRAGLYRLVLRGAGAETASCEGQGEGEPPPPLSDLGWMDLSGWISAQCSLASVAFLDFLRKRHRLYERFLGFYRLYCLPEADWLHRFLHRPSVQRELWKKRSQVNLSLLQYHLNDVLHSAGLFKPDEVSVRMEAIGTQSYLLSLHSVSATSPQEALPSKAPVDANLKGKDLMDLDLPLHYPLSLALDPTLLLQYRLLFRRLFQFHQLSLRLDESRANLSEGNLCAFLWKQLSAVLSAYLSFLHNDVLSFHLGKFRPVLESGGGLEEVEAAHAEALTACLKDALMTENSVLGPLGGVLEVVEDFLWRTEASEGEAEVWASLGRQLHVHLSSLSEAMTKLASAQQSSLATRFNARILPLLQSCPWSPSFDFPSS